MPLIESHVTAVSTAASPQLHRSFLAIYQA